MISFRVSCLVNSSYRKWMVLVLSTHLIFSIPIEKNRQDIAPQKNLILISDDTVLLVVRSICHWDGEKRSCELDVHLEQSLYLYSIHVNLILDGNRLKLTITLRTAYGSQLSGSLVKQKALHHHHWVTGFQQTELKADLVNHGLHCRAGLTFADVIKNVPCLTTIIVWLYIYHHIRASARVSNLFKCWSKEGGPNQTTRHTMLAYYVIVSFVAMSICTLLGFLTNSFIIVVHGMDRAKGKNINPRELILFTLGLFNIFYQCSMAANDTVLFLWSDFYFSDNVYAIFSVLLLFPIFSSFWFTFCLCGFYYIMLNTFKRKAFMRLKLDIARVVPWMLTFSVLLSLTISVPVTWNIVKDDNAVLNETFTINNGIEHSIVSGLLGANLFNNDTIEHPTSYSGFLDGNITNNFTTEFNTPHMSLRYLLVTSIIGCCIPLILVAIANILIIKSLCIHAKRLGKSSGGMSVQSVEASVSAAWTVTSLLLLYISFYVSQILLIMGVFDPNNLWFSICLVVIYAYSPIQSIILILGSPKLKSTMIKFLRFFGCKKNTFPSESVKAITPSSFGHSNNQAG